MAETKKKVNPIKANLNTRERWKYEGTSGNYKRVKVITHRWSIPADDKSAARILSQLREAAVRASDKHAKDCIGARIPPNIWDYIAKESMDCLGFKLP